MNETTSLLRASVSAENLAAAMDEVVLAMPQVRSAPDMAAMAEKSRRTEKALFKTPPLRMDYDHHDISMCTSPLERSLVGEALRRQPSMREEKTTPMTVVKSLPSVLIAVLLNLMICIPFGLSFFPLEWESMPAPRAIGIQMFLLTTVICQFIFAARSSFDCSVGMMMVENVPFMHTLSMSILKDVGMDSPAALPTILVTYALSTVVVGVLFYALGHFRLGSIVYLFPKHIIIGAIGGIGAFVVQSGIQNATGVSFEWTYEGLVRLAQPDILWLWIVSVILVLLLGVLLRFNHSPLCSPFFFVSIPPLFYVALLVCGIPVEAARANGWFFDKPPAVPFYALWTYYDFSVVEWSVIPKQMGTLVGLSLFSLMHVPINIPSLSLTTGLEVDINEELKAHGISNTLGGVCGSVQNYLCYSTSALYYKCGGGGRLQSFLIGAILSVFFFTGPSAVAYVPRCMAGCLMIHVGLDLCKEAVVDTYHELDLFEYTNVWIIALTMTFWGMNEGLAVGALLACITFVVQSAPAGPLRGSMSAATLRSTAWRSTADLEILDCMMRNVHVVQLKGHLFFGNIHKLSEYVATLLESQPQLEYLVVDFTLVVALDSSAADRLTKLKHVCSAHDVHLVFTAIPPAYERFKKSMVASFGSQKTKSTCLFHAAEDLNGAIEWCESGLLRQYKILHTPVALSPVPEKPAFVSRLEVLCPHESPEVIQALLGYFEQQVLETGACVWRQGDSSNSSMILAEGRLQAIVEEEAGTTEDIPVGALVGELCLLTGEKRKTSMYATEPSVVYVLTLAKFQEMLHKDSYLAFLFQGIALRYVSLRLQYVGNRIWESKCIPI
ncbi:Sulfate Permease (SulP) Family [Achlya hypogyna]|uniref:Sulfate Permease (SulP) Family n=1 Tax=Achlya hypogyna TaxID=1202772 RepID=A0A1V9ZFJ5_ACHHY|nr:Sulfate Permease (SulP) Family [Achlya hypogyna]